MPLRSGPHIRGHNVEVAKALLIATNAVGLVLGLLLVRRQRSLRKFLLALILYLVVWLMIFAPVLGRFATVSNGGQVLLSLLVAATLYLVAAPFLWRRSRSQ